MYYLILSVLFLLTGCSNEEEWNSSQVNGNYTLKASIEDDNALSRTTVNDAGQVLWVADDRIGVFGNKSTKNEPFTLTGGIGETSGTFKGNLPVNEEAQLAYYPYTQDAELNGNVLTFTLPSEYTYTGNSNAPMLAMKGEDGNFRFRHLAGLLKITVDNIPEGAAKFVITSEGEYAPGLAGEVEVKDITAQNPVLTLKGTGNTTVTYHLDSGPKEERLTFFIPMPIGKYSKLSVSLIMDDDTSLFTKTISEIEVRRAVMITLPILETDSESTVTPDYVPIDWKETNMESMNLSSGEFTLAFNGNEMPAFRDSFSIIVLQTDTSAYLKRVMSSSVNGNRVTLKTMDAGMNELFRNTEFTLSLSPEEKSALTKSSTDKNTIYPTKIVQKNNDGTYIVLYDEQRMTRADLELGYRIPFVSKDLSGETIASSKEGNLTLSWESFIIDLALYAKAHFKFSEPIHEKYLNQHLKVKVSELENCNFSIGAEALLEMIPLMKMEGKYSLDEQGIPLFPDLLPSFYFVFPTAVPVAITLSGELLADCIFNGKAEIEIKGGVTFEANLNLGIEYNKQTDWQPMNTPPTANFTLHPLEAKGDVEINAKLAAYPKFEMKLYDFIGPTFVPKPYFKDTLKAGFYNQLGSVNDDYYGWTHKMYTGFEFYTGLKLDFLGMFEQEIELPFVEPIEQQIFNAPNKIELVTPTDGTRLQIGKTVSVTFNVSQMWLGESQPNPGVVVKFESENGHIDKNFILTDWEGNATAQWTPQNDKATLKAKVFDSTGEVLKEAIFTPVIETSNSALKEFYETSGGDNWYNNDGWLTNQDITTWYGIKPVSYDDTYILDLYENNLTGNVLLRNVDFVGGICIPFNPIQSLTIENCPGISSVALPGQGENLVVNTCSDESSSSLRIEAHDDKLKDVSIYNIAYQSLDFVASDKLEIDKLDIKNWDGEGSYAALKDGGNTSVKTLHVNNIHNCYPSISFQEIGELVIENYDTPQVDYAPLTIGDYNPTGTIDYANIDQSGNSLTEVHFAQKVRSVNIQNVFNKTNLQDFQRRLYITFQKGVKEVTVSNINVRTLAVWTPEAIDIYISNSTFDPALGCSFNGVETANNIYHLKNCNLIHRPSGTVETVFVDSFVGTSREIIDFLSKS